MNHPRRLIVGMLMAVLLGGCAAGPSTIVALGDSNGAAPDGWVEQLRTLRPQDMVINQSISGNTIGFDNPASNKNTLANIDRYLDEAQQQAGDRTVTDVVVCLGTNDSKAVFGDRRDEVVPNLARLIERIRAHRFADGATPRVVIVSPPPYGPDAVLREKYHGGAARVRWLVPRFATVASEYGCTFVDVHRVLEPIFDGMSPDGVHLNPRGQLLIAEMISAALDRP